MVNQDGYDNFFDIRIRKKTTKGKVFETEESVAITTSNYGQR